MEVKAFTEILGADFYTGVPDSQLKALCDYLMDEYGVDPKHHIIGANEGNCVGIAAGYHLATGKVPVVYMQNSGEGNTVNPVASLLNENVYSIPAVFVIGWRGEPGVKDEPQHKYQGMITLKLLEDMNIRSFVVGRDTQAQEVADAMKEFHKELSSGRQVAFVIRKDAISYDKKVIYTNESRMLREEIISHIVQISKDDPIISTTGKASRELFEIRERNGQKHENDFLTVGSMGHASSIALGLAAQRPEEKIWCIDGDGAVLMHMGAFAVIGASKPENLIHVVINNGAHESVGGMPTAAGQINLAEIALACGYSNAVCVKELDSLDRELQKAKDTNQLTMIEVKCAIGARENLGRPTVSALENKEAFMKRIAERRK